MPRSCAHSSGSGVRLLFALGFSAAIASAGYAASGRGGGPPPNYGLNWATITHAGNAPWVGQHGGSTGAISWGDVSYEYRIAKTEVSNAQWLDFVRAAAPFVPAIDRRSPAFVSAGIVAIGNQFVMAEPANWAARAGWRYAAWYANWTHNGQKSAGVATAADFATGAYDISTFNYSGEIGATDQVTRSPGAQFWIASIDEWVKGVYFDPNRYGADQPGYWLYPGSQDTPLITAPASSGGQTNLSAGPLGQAYTLEIGQYPHVTGPWGLLDVSGNAREWLEDKVESGRYSVRSEPTIPLHSTDVADRLNWKWVDDVYSLKGVRLASAVPAPGVSALACVVGFAAARRSRAARRSLARPCGHALG